MPSPAGPTAARDLNTARVLEILRDSGPLTQADLIRRSGLTRPTVSAIVRTLLDESIAMPVGHEQAASVGRPGALLAFNPRCATAAVVRVLPAVVDLWVVDCEGVELGHGQVANAGDAGGCLDRIRAELERLSSELSVPRPTSVGMLLVGRVDPTTHLCTGAALSADPLPIAFLERRLAAAVCVLNPSAAAALGVARAGRHTDALVIFLDQGIGAGLVCGGQVLLGATGAAGELGHCRVPGEGRDCWCGRRGCLETVAAGWFLRARVAEILRSSRAPRTLAELERLGDDRVDAVLAQAAWHLGLAACWLVNVMNPKTVLLGGTPFAAGAARFLESFASAVVENAVAANAEGLIIDVASDRADIDGAIQAALDRLRIGRPVRTE
jgi:predicted NBD/HSP70 family sugar kinase